MTETWAGVPRSVPIRSLSLVGALLLGAASAARAQPAPAGEDEAAEDVEIVEEILDEDETGFRPHSALVDFISVSSKVTQRPQQSPASVWVISREQIELMRYDSVGEALADVPGLFVTYDLQNHHVAVRGLLGGARAGSRLLKIMIDGRVVGFVQGGVYFLGPEFIPMRAVERVEVLRGPASALYGAGAYVGAINIVTRREIYEGGVAAATSFRIKGVAAGQRGFGGEVVQTIVGENGHLLIAGSYHRLDRSGLGIPARSPFAQTIEGTSRDDLAMPVSLLARGEYFLGEASLSVMAVAQVHDYTAEFHDLAPMTGTTRVDVWDWASSATVEHAFGAGWSVLGTAAIAGGAPLAGDRLAYGDVGSGDYTRREFSYVEGSGQVELRRAVLDRGWLLAGIDGSHDVERLARYIDHDGATGAEMARTAPPAASLTNVAVYGQALVPVGGKVSLAGGLRYDQHSQFGGDASARAGAVVAVDPRLALKALVGRSYKAPSAEQLFGRSVTTGDVIGGEELGISLRPQYLDGAEVIADGYATSNINVNAAAYVNRYDDALAYVLEAGRLNPRSFDGWAVGGEATARAVVTTGTVTVEGQTGLAVQRLLVESRIVGGFDRKLIPDNEGVPVVTAMARVGVRLAQPGLGLFARYRWTGERTPSQSNLVADGTTEMSAPSYVLAPYHMLDLGLVVRPVRIDPQFEAGVALKITNVFDADYSEIGFGGIDIPGLPRTFTANLDVEF